MVTRWKWNTTSWDNNRIKLQGGLQQWWCSDDWSWTGRRKIRKNQLNNKNGIDNDGSSDKSKRDVPTNISKEIEVELPNEIKALSGRKFTGDELTTYRDAFGPKKEGMIRILGFNTSSIQLDEIRSTCQESINQQVNIQCFQELCRDTRNRSILQLFLTDRKKSDRASKSIWGASELNVGNDYKSGCTLMVDFGKTVRRVIQKGIDDLGRWSWMAFKGEDNKVILIMSIYQCCKNYTNP